VSVEFANQLFDVTGWSEKFCPTEGRSRTLGIPRLSRTVSLPIPELRRICGVPTLPAESMISLEAVTVYSAIQAE
jgi:hypothetical protein